MPSTLNISLMAVVQKASFSFLYQQSRIFSSLPHSTRFDPTAWSPWHIMHMLQLS